ncbi:MAG: nickel-binding protein [Gaiellaceae bacterium]
MPRRAIVSSQDGVAVERGATDARLAAEQLASEGTPVRYMRLLFVPEDETCFYIYEADSSDAVAEAAQRAELRFERVIEAIAQPLQSQ